MDFALNGKKVAANTVHKCIATRKGDWVIFTCPICKDYERHMNLYSGNMKLVKGYYNEIPHQGFHAPVGIQPELMNMN